MFKIYPALPNKNRMLPPFFFFFLIPVFAVTGEGWSLSLLGRNSLQSLPAQCHVVERVSNPIRIWFFSHIRKARTCDPLFSSNNLSHSSAKKNGPKPLFVCFFPAKINSAVPQVYLTNWRSFYWTLCSNSSFSSPEAGILLVLK